MSIDEKEAASDCSIQICVWEMRRKCVSFPAVPIPKNFPHSIQGMCTKSIGFKQIQQDVLTTSQPADLAFLVVFPKSGEACNWQDFVESTSTHA